MVCESGNICWDVGRHVWLSHSYRHTLAYALYVFLLVQLHQGIGVGGRANGYSQSSLVVGGFGLDQGPTP